MSHDLPPQSSAAAAGDKPVRWAKATRYMAPAFLVIVIALLPIFLVPFIRTVALGFVIAFPKPDSKSQDLSIICWIRYPKGANQRSNARRMVSKATEHSQFSPSVISAPYS